MSFSMPQADAFLQARSYVQLYAHCNQCEYDNDAQLYQDEGLTVIYLCAAMLIGKPQECKAIYNRLCMHVAKDHQSVLVQTVYQLLSKVIDNNYNEFFTSYASFKAAHATTLLSTIQLALQHVHDLVQSDQIQFIESSYSSLSISSACSQTGMSQTQLEECAKARGWTIETDSTTNEVMLRPRQQTMNQATVHSTDNNPESQQLEKQILSQLSTLLFHQKS